jgi:hypothetical protein
MTPYQEDRLRECLKVYGISRTDLSRWVMAQTQKPVDTSTFTKKKPRPKKRKGRRR